MYGKSVLANIIQTDGVNFGVDEYGIFTFQFVQILLVFGNLNTGNCTLV